MKEVLSNFVHLHNHTEYSLLDGAARIKDLIQQARAFHMPALAITDHGNLFGAIEFYRTAQDAGVKPIIGAEIYVAPTDRREKKIHAEISESSFHLTLLCKDLDGYHNLIKLVTFGYLEGFYYRPRVDKDLLAQYHKGLIALSGCLKGEINYFLLAGKYERAKESAHIYQSVFGQDNFYLELTKIGLKENDFSIKGLKEIGKELNLPLVATNDCHYLKKEDAKAHDVLLCIQTGKKLTDKARLRFESLEVHFKSPEEMTQVFAELPEAITNTREIADKCNLLLENIGKKFFLPAYPRPEGFASDFEYLKNLSENGLKQRYHRVTPALEERLQYELSVIHKMGFSGYFLVVKDIIDFARRKSISVGPGRGSAVGSLVLYTLSITDIDPLRYGLLFERFLTPERISLPDIDVDFADNRRDEVINYIRERYGKDNVAQIITFGTMQARAAVRDVGRVMDIPLPVVDRIAKLIPFNTQLAAALKDSSELRNVINSKPEYQELWEISQKVEGLARHASIHASGVVIAPKPLMEFVPLYRSADENICTQYDMNSLDAVGLLKMDILGLRTLTVIEKTFELLQEQGIHLDKKTIPLDDKKTYQLLQKAETVGIFQLESHGMRDILRQSVPDKIEDIIAVISLYRPGPLGMGISEFIKRKRGDAPVSYLHPLMKEALQETYGIIVYQEQVMRIAGIIAGFTLSEADKLRRAMGKKIPEEMEAMRESFIDGAKKNRIKPELAQKIFDTIAPFAGYGFNKSHSAGYAYLSYLTAYLKTNHPLQFLIGAMTCEIGDQDKINKFVDEAKRMGIEVLAPDINQSQYPFTIEGNKIRFGLGGIKNVGQGVCEKIVEERQKQGEYKALFEFLRRTRAFANRKAYESLTKAGALASIHPDRKFLFSQLDKELAMAGSKRVEFAARQTSFFGLVKDESRAEPPESGLTRGSIRQPDILGEETGPLTQKELLQYELDAFGFHFSLHPLENYRSEYESLATHDSTTVNNLVDFEPVNIGGVITSKKLKRDKKGNEYAVISLKDFNGSVEVMVFNQLFEQTRQILKQNECVMVKGTVRVRSDGMQQIFAESIQPLEALRGLPPEVQAIKIKIHSESLEENLLEKIKEELENYPGNSEVYIEFGEDNAKRKLIRLKNHKVTVSTPLLNGLKELLGPDSIKLSNSSRQTEKTKI
jgi:DNA polymerase-3 subunit alpha